MRALEDRAKEVTGVENRAEGTGDWEIKEIQKESKEMSNLE